MELIAHAHIHEHANCGPACVQFGEGHIVEIVAVELEVFGSRNDRFLLEMGKSMVKGIHYYNVKTMVY